MSHLEDNMEDKPIMEPALTVVLGLESLDDLLKGKPVTESISFNDRDYRVLISESGNDPNFIYVRGTKSRAVYVDLFRYKNPSERLSQIRNIYGRRLRIDWQIPPIYKPRHIVINSPFMPKTVSNHQDSAAQF